MPKAIACRDCHGGRDDFLLGVEEWSLGQADAKGLTMTRMKELGLLSPVPATTTKPVPEDSTGKAAAALGWLHANCGHCHNDRTGYAKNTGLFLDLAYASAGVGVTGTAAMAGVINDRGVWFFLDTHVQLEPSAEQIAEATLQATYRLKLFGIEPKVALLSHSNFGSHDNASAAKMRKVFQLIKQRVPKLEVDGEMQADTAWDEELRHRIFPNTLLKGRANLFVMPNLDAANITYNMVRVMTEGVAIGPILMGLDKPANILTPASTPRRVVNMTAIAAVDAQIRASLAHGSQVP